MGYDPEEFDIRDPGTTVWYVLLDDCSTPAGAGWRFEYRFADKLQALLRSLLLRARRVPYQLVRLSQPGRPDWPAVVTDGARLGTPAEPSDAPFTGRGFEHLFESQGHIELDAPPSKRL